MTIIDLGELRDDVTPDPPRPRPRAVGRRYRFLGALLLALVTLAAATPVPRRVVLTVPGRPASEVFLAGNRMYAVELPEPNRDGGRRLVAYELAGSRIRERWHTLLPAGTVPVGAAVRSGRLLVSGRSADDASWESVGIDPRTGRIVWRESGVLLAAGEATLLGSVDVERGGTAFRRIDVATGRALWSVVMPTTDAYDHVDFEMNRAGLERLVLVPASGPVQVHDAVSGVRQAVRDLHPGELPALRRTLIAAGLLLELTDGGSTVTAYDLDRLQRRWSAALPLVDHAERCGRLLCAFRQTGGMWALDPATGRTVWTSPRWQSVLAAAPGRLLLIGPTADASEQAVVDEATGRLIAEQGDWRWLPSDDPDEPMIAVRSGRDGRVLVAELDPALDRPRIRAVLTGATGDCRTGPTLVVCRRTDGGFGVWTLP
ncbi:PQQ-binding-like beta-propeller repeat protein [Micromonospora auratinigra]|uniref:PQQ-like domain-containing protein n=1 Tax=Micromonospora auratinigra TaxID=261654 RepID=A0A1A9AC23_9ACTN|nr:PQQ-binding-like beta-propeller repeat protein [Micromonospora auratinigra]SBT53656.1 hypothetical protein GA0070611_6231 [Micromonospora auratinigra]